jgi:hypothetical protein
MCASYLSGMLRLAARSWPTFQQLGGAFGGAALAVVVQR